MEEKKERKAVAKKLITPNMQEWKPVSPKMPEKIQEAEESVTEEQVVEEPVVEEPENPTSDIIEDLIEESQSEIEEELNVKTVTFVDDLSKYLLFGTHNVFLCPCG